MNGTLKTATGLYATCERCGTSPACTVVIDKHCCTECGQQEALNVIHLVKDAGCREMTPEERAAYQARGGLPS
jgi:hypothetical protein